MVRHFDEWRRKAQSGASLRDEQKRSMEVLTTSFGFGFPIVANLAGDVVLNLWQWDYSALERDLMDAARAIAAPATLARQGSE